MGEYRLNACGVKVGVEMAFGKLTRVKRVPL